MNQPISTHPESRTPVCERRSRPWPLPAHLRRVRWLCGLLGILLLLSMAAGMARAQSEFFLGPTYSWGGRQFVGSSGSPFDEVTPPLNLVRTDRYYCSLWDIGFFVSGNADGNGYINDESTGEAVGALFGGTAFFNSEPTSSISLVNSYSLFQDTYAIAGIEYSICLSTDQDGNVITVLAVTERYKAAGSTGGRMSVSYRNKDDTSAGGKFSGNDPVAGDFHGSFTTPGTLIFDGGRSAPSFVPTASIWVNSTLLQWKGSVFMNSIGAVTDTYEGILDGHAIEVKIVGDLLLFKKTGNGHVDPVVTIAVADDNGDLVKVASGSYKQLGSNPNYFIVGDWYVGKADFSRHEPVWATGTRNLWVNGIRYGFRGGIDDAAGNSQDIYGNDSAGKLVISGNTTVTHNGVRSAAINATFNGNIQTGTFEKNANNVFSISVHSSYGYGMLVETSGLDVPGIWVDGHLYMRSAGSGNAYIDTVTPFRRLMVSQAEDGTVNFQGNDEDSSFGGSVVDASAGGVFYCLRTIFPFKPLLSCLVNRDRLFITGPSILPGMPVAVKVDGKIWTGISSASFFAETGDVHQCSYYGNATDSPSSLLRISDSGRVTLLNFIAGTSKEGTYSFQTRFFQTAPESPASNSLPMPMYRTKGFEGYNNERDWGNPTDGRPATVAVDGHVWGFVASTDGNVHYAGEYYGQELIIRPPNGRNGTSQVSLQMGIISGASVSYSGVFYNGGFTMNGGSPPVTAGNGDGVLVNPTDGLGRYQNVVADLDITGNILTLGSWAGDSTLSHAGMALQYSEAFTLPGTQPLPTPGRALIYMTGSRQDTSFLWNHATPNSASNAPMMLLAGADHSLRLYAPATPTVPTIVLNPGGRSRFDKPIRIEKQGDLEMGEFTHGPGEP